LHAEHFFELVDFPAFGHILIITREVEEQIANSMNADTI
jgi:hypothetical protein